MSRVFLKGLQYVQNGAILHPVRQGMTLKAYCYGSLPEPYHVQVTCDDAGIATALCSCPVGTPTYGRSGCKHAAALLLTWSKQPETFAEMDDLDTVLERREKAELILLIKQLLQKQPEVEWELTMPPLPQAKRHMSIDIEVYRRQVDAAFDRASHQWDAVYGISSDLYDITYIADQFTQQGDYANAIAIYEVVAREILERYLSYHDEDSALGTVVQDCVKNLGHCLASEQEDQNIRQRILKTIFTIYRFNVDEGGYGFTDDIPLELMQHTTSEEKRTIAQWVRAALSETDASWGTTRYGGLLLALEAETLSDEEFLSLGRQTNRVHEVVNRLLELGRVDEAVQEVQSVRDRDLLKLANLFLQHGQDRAILPVIHERSRQTQGISVPEWLKDYYLARNDTNAALAAIEVMFRIQFRLQDYQHMRELATQLGIWETKRQELLAFLQTTKHIATLVEIALDEGDVERALKLLKGAPSSDQGWMYNYDLASRLALKAAEQAEETQPHASLDLYQQHVEQLIAAQGRGRGNYQAACSYLTKIRALYERLGEVERWTDYIFQLRKRHSRLHTLKTELTAAGL